MTSDDKKDLGFAVFASIVGGVVGYYVTKKTHPVVGTIVGVAVGAIAVPATVEAVKRLQS